MKLDIGPEPLNERDSILHELRVLEMANCFGQTNECVNELRARQDALWKRLREFDEATLGGGYDAALATWSALIEQRWRGLSDGERLRLMATCCPRCGAIKPCEHPR